MAPNEEPTEPLKYQTWVLRVSIHCEGCKKKVKRVLHSVEGVYETEFDVRQHKVTVTANVNVDPEVLVRKLIKSGKHAELWPEKKPTNPSPNTNDAGNGKSKKKASTKPNEVSETPETSKNISSNDTSVVAAKVGDAPKVVSGEAAKTSGKEVSKSDGEDSASSFTPSEKSAAPVSQAAAADGGEKPAADPAASSASGSGGKKKKKKKKAKKPNAPAGNGGSGGAVSGGEADSEEEDGNSPLPPQPHAQPQPQPQPQPQQAAASPPRHPAYHVPMYTPQPVYAVSYSTSHPSASYGSTYYAPATPQSYVYSGHPPVEEYYGPIEPASNPQGSYDFFSEENANACSIM